MANLLAILRYFFDMLTKGQQAVWGRATWRVLPGTLLTHVNLIKPAEGGGKTRSGI
jgi:hypothetical protein